MLRNFFFKNGLGKEERQKWNWNVFFLFRITLQTMWRRSITGNQIDLKFVLIQNNFILPINKHFDKF